MKNYKMKTSFVRPEGLKAQDKCFKSFHFCYNVREKLKINQSQSQIEISKTLLCFFVETMIGNVFTFPLFMFDSCTSNMKIEILAEFLYLSTDQTKPLSLQLYMQN